jgi:peptidoglycan hydrolase-like protein with peptidoglycan-binding domain
MARDFFKRATPGKVATSGTVITDIQRALNAAGASIDTDGIYGGQTTTALETFQTANSLPVNGKAVSDATWAALMHTGEPPMFERCLQVVASFEGTGFTLIEGNFDGAGLTWSIIGFTLSEGELGSLLADINATFPALFSSAFGSDAATILKVSGPTTSKVDKIAFADSVSRGASKTKVIEPWKTAFDTLGKFEEVQKMQIARARDKYWTAIAVRDANDLGLKEELDYLLMYDIAVQNGGMRSKKRLASARDAIAAAKPTTARQTREIIANVVVETISSKFKEDVRSRKMSVARGNGTIHGGAYDFADWGCLDGQKPAAV